MLYSQKEERARRFRLALRMGIPILLLIFTLLFFIVKQKNIVISGIDISLLTIIFFISIYFLFFLINIGQNESYIDRITKTFRREYLIPVLKKQVSKSKVYTLVLFRIDNLSSINDHYGIERGDKILFLFVHILNEYMQFNKISNSVIGRYHGSDFIIGIPIKTDKVIELFNDFSSTYKEINDTSVEYKFVAVNAKDDSNVKHIINHLYDLISQQKYKIGKKIKEKKSSNFTVLENEIVEAVKMGNLILHYVPTLSTKTKEIDMFEVTVQLQTEKSGLLPPKKFIPVINRLGFERIFDEALFEAICKDASLIKKNIQFSFNISPFSLRNDLFAQTIKKIAHKYNVSNERLIIELYENRVFKDIKKYKVILDECKESGFMFALDNFGVLNASFEYIKQLPVDMIQFDKSFTISYNNPKISSLLKGYIQACKNMHIKTLLKWVDNEKSMDIFTQLGVDYIQGFIVSNRPIDSKTLIKKYKI